jgi:alcohol dehydrogenase
MGYPLTYFKGLPHGLANGVLTIEYLKSFKNKTKLEKILNLLNLNSLEELEEIFSQLFKVNIPITKEEIMEYSKALVANKGKLKNHPEEVSLENILEIYSKSLLK